MFAFSFVSKRPDACQLTGKTRNRAKSSNSIHRISILWKDPVSMSKVTFFVIYIIVMHTLYNVNCSKLRRVNGIKLNGIVLIWIKLKWMMIVECIIEVYRDKHEEKPKFVTNRLSILNCNTDRVFETSSVCIEILNTPS